MACDKKRETFGVRLKEAMLEGECLYAISCLEAGNIEGYVKTCENIEKWYRDDEGSLQRRQ